jgi:hypothetical protein
MYRIFKLLIMLFMPSFINVASSPLYGGEKHHYDKSAVAPEFQPKQVQLATGTAECVRTAWIGDIRNRTVICVEWRRIRREGR